ncbi:hypothetical protein ACERII_10335 [Evansella sp. AB-rgal1]|uniref:hypothetical protein n=1 Tax=Evansella sp. AB-rgal1 TaxID=3242696 RepID=UPI00359CCFC5
MDTAIYFSLSFVYGLLLAFGIYAAFKKRWALCSIFLLLVIAALMYDNSILALGRYIGQGALLESLNVPRYWMHALFTPLLIPFVWQTLRSADVTWIKTSVATCTVIFLTGTIILLEVIPLFGIELQAVWQNGVLSYTRVNKTGAPFMIIIVTLTILLTSILLWRKQGWKWLFIGLVLMGVVGLLANPFHSKAMGNVSELVLIISLLATHIFQQKQRESIYIPRKKEI